MNSTLSDSRHLDNMRKRSKAITNCARRALLFVVLALVTVVPAFADQPGLLLNGDLRAGSDDSPAHWTRSPSAPPGSLKWALRPAEAGELEIYTSSGQFRTFYWTQRVKLAEPGWYHFRAEVKTDNPGVRATLKLAGARSSGGATETSLDWKFIDVYFKVAGSEDVDIGCGVRGISAGQAYFRNLTLTSIAGTPPSGARLIDLTPVADLPRSEMGALHDVDLAKAPAGESLWRDVLNPRVLVTLVLILGALTYFDRGYTASRATGARFFHDREVRKSAAVAAFLCLTLMGTWLVTRLEYLPGHGFYLITPHAVGGDEPHYLIMVNSLLVKRDLQLKRAYDDVEGGGPEAGVMSRGIELDHHTIIVNRHTGHRAMDMPWYEASPEFAGSSSDTYEVPVHPAGFPLLMALAVAPLNPERTRLNPTSDSS